MTDALRVDDRWQSDDTDSKKSTGRRSFLAGSMPDREEVTHILVAFVFLILFGAAYLYGFYMVAMALPTL
ncbi:hypothetical protein ELG72_37670 [Rhizobium leguminosarum]|uniref:hypothetical protein n=1 Tax=Rhizobium TaxID=379 RepID=UPI00103075C5|nr:hypothetical protein [Rhizobium leguminosarum]TBF87883.1 hypothetical protein ELG82_37430 [Rhizobium leguminosarum]TBG07136.1 hypothetical protein ELG80_37265 [Rhizobium leguminosarum]TBG07700.1 hypothetical protein ELG81_37570 [Rhizobium leguminosarum]TBG30820.1 hypothetical protein ELG75_36965 [Rhizobium leguminosarum]TBG50066.1 hypothetical protein ELG72_37670 [Rhizobium leguminosarum]